MSSKGNSCAQRFTVWPILAWRRKTPSKQIIYFIVYLIMIFPPGIEQGFLHKMVLHYKTIPGGMQDSDTNTSCNEKYRCTGFLKTSNYWTSSHTILYQHNDKKIDSCNFTDKNMDNDNKSEWFWVSTENLDYIWHYQRCYEKYYNPSEQWVVEEVTIIFRGKEIFR
jgi:hypothetical protein